VTDINQDNFRKPWEQAVPGAVNLNSDVFYTQDALTSSEMLHTCFSRQNDRALDVYFNQKLFGQNNAPKNQHKFTIVTDLTVAVCFGVLLTSVVIPVSRSAATT
jgi:hypothetical protein